MTVAGESDIDVAEVKEDSSFSPEMWREVDDQVERSRLHYALWCERKVFDGEGVLLLPSHRLDL